MRLRRFAFVCAVGACILAACGNNGLLGTTVATQSAIRVINGSPDAAGSTGGINVFISGTTTALNGSTALAYGKATTLSYVNSQSYTVTVNQSGSTSSILSCATPTLGANTRYTVVIAGEKAGTGNSALQCQIFAETVYSLPAGSFQLAFHNASPALNAISPLGAGYGTFANSSPPVYNNEAGPLAMFTAPTSGVANGIAQNVLPAGSQAPPGIGVYVSTVTSSSGAPNPPSPGNVQATLLPSQLQPGYITAIYTPAPSSSAAPCTDPNNLYPYYQSPSPTPSPASTTAPTPSPTPSPVAGACAALSTVMSVYAIDALPGSGNVASLVGVSD
ncbi:MAG TPA: DUF4397 domain-containing protein [Candidatus Elarobacter sp.]|jgi:hypothetical protein